MKYLNTVSFHFVPLSVICVEQASMDVHTQTIDFGEANAAENLRDPPCQPQTAAS